MMRIGEVASRAGVNIQTLRYYERRGLIPEPRRRASGYREFGPDTVRLVRFVKHAQELGFTLREVEELIALREHPSENAVAVCEIAAAKADDIARRVRRLTAVQRALETLIATCESGRGKRECPIIEALDDESPTSCSELVTTHMNGGCHADH
jgi:Hg(II)-responsive transcriptional regulator